MAAFARDVLARLPQKTAGATILALSGELGAGKTTFVQQVGRELSVAHVIQSPTYVLVKTHRVPRGRFAKLVHIDLYRLEKPEELAPLKLEKIFTDSKALVCIEWPERGEGGLPEPDVTLRFSSHGANERERYIEGHEGEE